MQKTDELSQDVDSGLSGRQSVFYTREVHVFGRLSCVSQLTFYVLNGIGKPSTIGRLGTAIGREPMSAS